MLLVFKIIAWCMIGGLIVLVGAISGLFFRLWPTLAKGEKIRTDDLAMRQLDQLRAQNHFAPSPQVIGIADLNRRAFLAQKFIDYIDEVRRGADETPTLFFLLAQTKRFLTGLGPCNPEEKALVAEKLRDVFDAFGERHSRGLISVWQNGLPDITGGFQKAQSSKWPN